MKSGLRTVSFNYYMELMINKCHAVSYAFSHVRNRIINEICRNAGETSFIPRNSKTGPFFLY